MIRMTYSYQVPRASGRDQVEYESSRIRAGEFFRFLEPYYGIPGVPSPSLAKGRKITVYYDPENPGRACHLLPRHYLLENSFMIIVSSLMMYLFVVRNKLSR